MKRLLTLILLCAAVCSASTTSINRISQVLTLTGAQTNMVEWNVPYTPDAVVLTCTSGSVRVWAARAQNIVRIAGVATTNDSGAWLDTGASAQWSPDGYGTCWLASTGTSAVVTLDVIGKRGDSGEEIQAALAGYATATDIAGATNAAVMRGNPLSVNGMTFGVAYQGTVATTQPGTDPSLGSAGCAQTSSVPGYTINSSGAYEYYEGWIQYCYSNSAGSLVYGAELGIDMMTSQNVDCTVYTRVLAMPATACGLGVRFRYAGISNGYWFKATVFRTSSAAMQTLPISFERTYPGSLIFNETTKPIASNPFSITASFTANRISNVIVNVDTSANPSAVATVGQFTGGTNAVTLHANAISNAAEAAYAKQTTVNNLTNWVDVSLGQCAEIFAADIYGFKLSAVYVNIPSIIVGRERTLTYRADILMYPCAKFGIVTNMFAIKIITPGKPTTVAYRYVHVIPSISNMTVTQVYASAVVSNMVGGYLFGNGTYIEGSTNVVTRISYMLTEPQ